MHESHGWDGARTAHELAFEQFLAEIGDGTEHGYDAPTMEAIQRADDLDAGGDRHTLLAGPADADARLAALRGGLLNELAELAPAGTSLARLGTLGDASPEGWLAAPREALELAARRASNEPRPGVALKRKPVDDGTRRVANALRKLSADAHPRATSVRSVAFAGIELTVEPRGETWNGVGRGPIRIKYRDAWELDSVAHDRWQAACAVLAGLWALPALAVRADVEQVVRGVLVRTVKSLLDEPPADRRRPASRHGQLSQGESKLDRMTRELAWQPGVDADRERVAAAWPLAFAAVMHRLDNLPDAPGAGRLPRVRLFG